MSEQRSKRMETEELSRVDRLLGLLGDLSQRDPSPALREQLSTLASQRLGEHLGDAAISHGRDRRPLVWLKPTLAAACLIAAALATGIVVHFIERSLVQSGATVKVSPPAISPDTGVHAAPAVRPSVPRHPKVHRPQPALAEPTSDRRMIMRLPYSNSTIATGTDTTIQVSMSQSELLSLGFPINTIAQDRRVIAELTLGDDGLPRAISLPLPLEVIKEKK